MKGLQLAICLVSLPIWGCVIARHNSEPSADVSESFAQAINSRDLDAAMSHWSEDAVLYIQSGSGGATVVSRTEIQENYEEMFAEKRPPELRIRVDGTERSGDVLHEWGSFAIGESTGCYVLLRRSVDDWKIHREWVVQPCGQ